VFVLRSILAVPSLSRTNEYVDLSDEIFAEKILAAVLQAPSKALLKAGIPIRNSARRKQTFDLDHFEQHENQPQLEFASINQGLREGRTDMPNPDTWCEELCKNFNLTSTSDQRKVMIAGLDAAYKYQCKIVDLSKNKNYDFFARGNVTAWGDLLQLFYLHDNSTYFVTTDEAIRTYCQGSTQSNRILLYSEFAKTLPTF
jgi:hypothetical protein